MSVTKNHFWVNTTVELVDTRFKLLCNEITLESQIRQNDENIYFGYRRDRIVWFVSVSGHNIVQTLDRSVYYQFFLLLS